MSVDVSSVNYSGTVTLGSKLHPSMKNSSQFLPAVTSLLPAVSNDIKVLTDVIKWILQILSTGSQYAIIGIQKKALSMKYEDSVGRMWHSYEEAIF